MAKLNTATTKAKNAGCLGKAIGAGIGLLVLFGFLMYLFNFASTDANRIGLHYGGGWVEDKKFKSVIPVGTTRKLIGPGDTVYAYPVDKRSYIIGGPGADTSSEDEVTVVSKDKVQLGVRVQVYFTLNQDESKLRLFHEAIGLKTRAYEDEGWETMLQGYFRPQIDRPQIDRALAAVATQYNWGELYSDETKKTQLQAGAAKEFTRLLSDAVGDFFCGPAYKGDNDCGSLSFTIQKPTPRDKAIIEAVEAKQRAELARQAQEQKNLQIQVELQSVRSQVQLLGPQGYLLKSAIESGKIQFMVIPQGSDVSVPMPIAPNQTPKPSPTPR